LPRGSISWNWKSLIVGLRSAGLADE
jgi:hypothetical protein